MDDSTASPIAGTAHFVPQSNPAILRTPHRYSVAWEERFSDGKTAFAAGRLCAAKAIESLDPTASREVGVHSDRTPHWPDGIVGSITHTAGFASAAVAHSSDARSLGIDSEKLLFADVLQSAQTLVLQDEERRLLTTLPLSREQGLILIFSAKESVYKCLYPIVNRRFDYSAVRIQRIDAQKGTFDFGLTEAVHTQFPASFESHGRFEFSYGCVHTAVELP